MPSPADELRDRLLLHHVDVMRYAEGVRERATATLETLAKELSSLITDADLGGAPTPASLRAAERVAREGKKLITSAYASAAKDARDSLIGLADVDRKWAPSLLKSVLGRKDAAPALNKSDLKAFVEGLHVQGAPLEDWWRKQGQDFAHRFAQQVRMGAAQGEPAGAIAARVRGRNTGRRVVLDVGDRKKSFPAFAGGIADTSRNEITALARTAAASVSQAVLNQTFQESGKVIEGVVWVSVLDARTSPVCRARSGGMWDLEGNPMKGSKVKIPFPGYPPAHFRCRSILVPVVGGESPEPSYEEWLRGQPAPTQRDVLGPAKYDLWKGGSLTVAQMVDNSGRALTVDELESRSRPTRKRLRE